MLALESSRTPCLQADRWIKVKPAIPPEDYDQASIGLVDPKTGKRSPVAKVDGYGTFVTLPDGSVTFTPDKPFEGSVTIKYFVKNNNGEWVVGWFTVHGGGTTPPGDKDAIADSNGDETASGNANADGDDSNASSDADSDSSEATSRADGSDDAGATAADDNGSAAGANSDPDDQGDKTGDSNDSIAAEGDREAEANASGKEAAANAQGPPPAADSDSDGGTSDPAADGGADDAGADGSDSDEPKAGNDGGDDKGKGDEDKDQPDIADDSNLEDNAPDTPGDVPELPSGQGDEHQYQRPAPRDETTLVDGDDDAPDDEPTEKSTPSPDKTDEVVITDGGSAKAGEPATQGVNGAAVGFSLGALVAVTIGGFVLFAVLRRKKNNQ
jgi:hypothetical protein